jgi:hypothetical protein
MSHKSIITKSLLLSVALLTPAFATQIQVTASGAIQFSNMSAFGVG